MSYGITYRADDWRRASAEWQAFGPKWAELRQIAAARGILFPPRGTAHDDRDAENPSQRAIIWRALEDNPWHLKNIVRSSSSWSEVVDRIFGMESRLRADAGETERELRHGRDQLPTAKEALQSVAAILGHISEGQP